MEAAAPASAPADSVASIWSQQELAILNSSEESGASMRKKLGGLFGSIIRSPYIAAKYPRLASAVPVHSVEPLSDEIQEWMRLAREKVSEFNSLLSDLLKSDRTEESQAKLKEMLHLGGEKPDEQTAFIKYALYNALESFVTGHIEDLRDPNCNLAILGSIIKCPEEPVSPFEVVNQAMKVKELREQFELGFISKKMRKNAETMEAHSIFLTSLEMLVLLALKTCPNKQAKDLESRREMLEEIGNFQERMKIHNRIESLAEHAIQSEVELGRSVKLFLEAKTSEDRFAAARQIVNSDPDQFPADIAIRVWRCLAENNEPFRGMFKGRALTEAFKIDKLFTDMTFKDMSMGVQCATS